MQQKEIKLRQNQPTRFEIEEVDANWSELDARTKSSLTGYNSIQELGEKIRALEYIAPAINSFTNNVGTVRMGAVVQSVKFDWAVNKEITSQSINQGVGSITPATARTKTITGQNITADITYQLTIGDGTGTATRTTKISFLNDRFWGVSASATLSNAQVLALANELSGSRAKSFSQNGDGKYIFYAWPKRLGAISNMNVNGLAFTAYTLVEQSVTNAEGFSELYYVLRTNTVQNGTLNISIT